MKRFILLFVCALALAVIPAHSQAAHSATFVISDSSCGSATQCNLQIWSAILPSGNCPAAGNSAYTQIIFDLTPTTTTTTNAIWNYVDSRAAMTSGSIYCSYETATFNSGGGPSTASAIFQGTIPASLPGSPSGTTVLK